MKDLVDRRPGNDAQVRQSRKLHSGVKLSCIAVSNTQTLTAGKRESHFGLVTLVGEKDPYMYVISKGPVSSERSCASLGTQICVRSKW